MLRSILRLVRYKNLIIVAATLYMMRFFIIQPLLWRKGMDLQLDELLFFFLAIATVFITAAGYVINDYFDTRTDLVNRPNTVVVGKEISRRYVILLHMVLSILGLLFGTIVSLAIGKPLLVLVFVLVPTILVFYSTTYKRHFLIGNIIVALFTALVPLMPLLFELPGLKVTYWQELVFTPSVFNDIIYWIGGYAIFAFWLTLFREIVKDIEDYDGDKEFGRKTLPIVLGVRSTRLVAASILFITITIISYLFGAHLNFLPSGTFDYFTFAYLLVGLIAPLFILIVRLLLAQEKKDYHWISSFTKLVMLMGILYSVYFRFTLV